ncbi:MAG TPA: SulP family inorganic anion transporter [Thermoanaerobaculia bacterium]|nr:SulP family inorganic anion transporter [Thermoanaerobaculia bacterium]
MTTVNTLATPRAMLAPQAGDFWGGLSAMLVTLPSAVAYGVVIFSAVSPSLGSAGALAGILGAAALGLVAPLVGRNGGFITAPCAPAAAVLSGFAAELVSRGDLSPERILVLLALTGVASGILQIIYGALRAGRLIKFIPYQVVTGYLSGVAVIIAMSQIPRLLGTAGGMKIADALVSPDAWRWEGIVVGAVTIIVMALVPRFTRAVPGAIAGFAAGIATYFALGAARPYLLQLAGNPLVVGPISAAGSLGGAVAERTSSLMAMRPSDLAVIAGAAFTLSILLSIDTLKTGVVLDALTRRRHESNRELVAQGVANLASVFTGGVPGAGTMGPTLVNITSGGRTPWSGVVAGALVLATFLAFARAIAWVPVAALAGVLLVVAWRMFDFKMFALLLRPSTRLDFVVIVAVVAVAASVGLIEAAAVGVGLAILLFIRNQMRGSVVLRRADLHDIRSKRRRSREELGILEERGRDALVVQLKDDLFFGTTDQLFTELEADLGERRFILLDFRRVQSMDYTAARLFVQMQERLRSRNGSLLFSGLPSGGGSGIESYMQQLNLIGRSDGIQIFETRDSALEWMEDRILETAGWTRPESAPPLPLDQIGLFRALDPTEITALEGVIEKRSLPLGAPVFAAGDPGSEIFFVRSGRVHILLPLEGKKRHHLATICRGEFFGEMAFLDQGSRSAIAEAATPTELFVLTRDAFESLAHRNHQIARDLYEELALALAQRLRSADAEVRALEER